MYRRVTSAWNFAASTTLYAIPAAIARNAVFPWVPSSPVEASAFPVAAAAASAEPTWASRDADRASTEPMARSWDAASSFVATVWSSIAVRSCPMASASPVSASAVLAVTPDSRAAESATSLIAAATRSRPPSISSSPARKLSAESVNS